MLDSHIPDLRRQFPALAKRIEGRPAVFLDGPAGTQVPRSVIEAISRYLTDCHANCSGRFATSRQSDELLGRCHEAVADFLGADDPACVAFGPNMTTLTFALSRALARTWRPGDEVMVTQLEHDANFTPWVLAARDAGATVRTVAIRPEDCTLDLEDFERKLSERTRIVAIGAASNAVGTINPVQKICARARSAGALTFVDAVHFAPHQRIDVREWDCDFLVASAYKFFGPHVGVLWGRRELLEETEPYKLRPAPDRLPGKWMTGTQNHEGIAGTKAAIDYLADVGALVARRVLTRSEGLELAFAKIRRYERRLTDYLLAGIEELKTFRIWGITDPKQGEWRLPTIAVTHPRYRSVELADHLSRQGIFTWHGNYYALPLTEALGLEPDGMLRMGLVHYNTRDEVDRVLEVLAELDE